MNGGAVQVGHHRHGVGAAAAQHVRQTRQDCRGDIQQEARP